LLQTSAEGKAPVKLLLLDTEDHEAAVIAEVGVGVRSMQDQQLQQSPSTAETPGSKAM
jgi:hypothetical protein